MNQNTKHFFGGLESLRGVAALIVVIHHTRYAMRLAPNHVFCLKGYLMVDLFFVLSGFVIYHNYSQKINSIKNTLHFMALRFGRLYPLHLFFLLLFLGIEIVKYINESRFGISSSPAFGRNNISSFLANFLLIQPFFQLTNKTFNIPSWSIGTEYYTYLLFAILALLFVGKRKFIFASVFVVSLTILLLSFWAGEGLSSDAGLSMLRCVLGFFAGVLAYQAYTNYHSRIAPWSGGVIWGIVLLLVLFFSVNISPKADYLVLPFFALLIISIAAAHSGGLAARALNSAPMRWMGAVSYSIYMSHWVILIMMGGLLELAKKHCNPNAGNFLELLFLFLAVAVVLAFSQLTHKWIELPFNKKCRGTSRRIFGAW